MKKSGRKKILSNILLYLLLFIALGLLSSPLLEAAVVDKVGETYLLDHYTREQLADNMANAKETEVEIELGSPDLTKVLKYASGIGREDVLGAIVIEAVGLYQPIFNGTTEANLVAGVGTMKSEQAMGEGNYCLAGHHYKNDSSLLFGPLLRVETGNWIQLTDKKKLFTYEVTEIKTVHQTEVEVLEETEESAVTLITCDVPGVNTNFRWIVRGKLIDTAALEDGKESGNPYLEAFSRQTASGGAGRNEIWLWVLCLGAISAVLLWIGNKLMSPNVLGRGKGISR